MLHRTVLESKEVALFCDTAGLEDVLLEQGVLQLPHVPCPLHQTRGGPSYLPSHSQMHTAWCCPWKPALYFTNPLCCAALLASTHITQGDQDSVTPVWFGGCHFQNNCSCRLIFFFLQWMQTLYNIILAAQYYLWTSCLHLFCIVLLAVACPISTEAASNIICLWFISGLLVYAWTPCQISVRSITFEGIRRWKQTMNEDCLLC